MSDKTGKVWLVGAGPGDAGLMTLQGRDALAQADVVVYDRLVGTEILGMIPAGARKIYVGKSAGRHTMEQEQINRLLLSEALGGNRVVRLKGGDPFLFGRGGEELERLAQNGVPVEVVPGVTSAIAVPAYAGIPVTHRGLSSSLHIFTGHARDSGGPDYAAIAGLEGTLVFLMGYAELPAICSGLVAAGMRPETPAAVISSGTTARQKTVTATVGTLAAAVTACPLSPPAVIVVGAVAALAGRFAWADSRPLNGMRIVVTRPRKQGGEFCRKIRQYGGEPVCLPCIETVPIAENRALEAAVRGLDEFSWLAFSSRAGVDAFFRELDRSGRDSRALAGLRAAAVGPSTAEELKAYGIRADCVPPRFSSEQLGKELAGRMRPGEKALYLRARGGSARLAEILAASGAICEEIAAYETVPAAAPEPSVRRLVESRDFDRLTFSSASAVRAFAGFFPGLDFSRCPALCIGEETASQARAYGMPAQTALSATADGLLDALLALRGSAAAGNSPKFSEGSR